MSRTAEFGIFSPQAGMSFKAIADRATQAEQLGYHSLWFVDHFWNRGIPDADCLESMALMSGVAARTEKLRIGTLVLCNSFRNPALLAKALTTIDHVSGGRLEIGLGAGWMDEEYRGYGYEFPTMGARLRQLEEGLKILKLLFGEKRASFAGRYFKLDDAINNPKPIQRPHPPITIGGSGEKVMLRIVAQYADRWNCPAGYKSFSDKLDVLKAHCTAVGRDIKSINISEQLLVCLGASEAEVEEKWKMAGRLKPFSITGIKGTPPQIVEQLRARVAQGITFFTIMFGDFGPPRTLDLFAREVMPAFA
ncbi:MAG TPA: TIGR03560 family F420-dependent LLM class oxidoreductase [Candidatus Binataceae bacterium]|nr:TIGR03560 family F420-dependent LLM class oxidoreductase [Candidatus Binataceae bacterium]